MGAIDCHIGSVGAQIKPDVLVKTIGTSTCDILMTSHDSIGDKVIRGICGQVDGSVIPGFVGMEAGQSAFGDIYAWFKSIMSWSLRTFTDDPEAAEEQIITRLSEKAAHIEPGESMPVALDWFNGRRTPAADPRMKGASGGLTLGTTPAMMFRALVEATAFGSRAIHERMLREGVNI